MPFEGIKLTDSAYIPQYTGLPLEAMEKVGDDLQTRHYDNIAKLRQLELFGLQQAAETPSGLDKTYIQNQAKSIQDALGEIAKSGGENATGKVGALATRFLGDEGLIRIKKNAEQYKAQEELKAKLGESAVYNKMLTDRYLQQGTINPDGTYNDFMNTAQERLDYMKKQDELLAPLTADVSQTNLLADMNTTLNAIGSNYEGDLGNMPVYLKTIAVKALTSKKMNDFLFKKGGWENYKTTSEYAQQKNILGMSDEEIKQELHTRAEAKVFEQVDKQWMTNKGFDFKAAQKQEGGIPGQGEQVANSKVPINITSGNYDDFLDKDREDAETPIKIDGGGATGSPGAKTTIGKVDTYFGPSKKISQERWKKLSESALLGASIFGDGKLAPVNEKSSGEERAKAVQYAKQYEDLVNQRVQFRMKDTSQTTRAGEEGRSNAEDLTVDMIDNIKNRVVFDETTGKIIPVVNKDGDEFTDDFIEAVGDLKNMKVTGIMDPENYVGKALKNEEMIDAFMVEVRDPEDPKKTRSLLVSQKAYDPKNQPRAAWNRDVNRIYVGFNSYPGKENTITLTNGLSIKGKELVGNQIDNELPPEIAIAAKQMQRPILVDIPNQGVKLVDGPKQLANYIYGIK